MADLPLDILPPILEQLERRSDWLTCSLVCKSFNRVATPMLYHTLDSRIISKTLLYHYHGTLINRPELAKYVRSVTETGAVHRGLLSRYPTITQDTLAALALCKNLKSACWIDDSSTTATTLISFLSVLQLLPIEEIIIRTHSDLGDAVWSKLIQLRGMKRVSIWCMSGPPRVLQGWSSTLGPTLTSLELGRCAGVKINVLLTVLSHLRGLKDLRLKGAPASSIPVILSFLPNLRSLDTDYLLTGHSPLFRRHQSLPCGNQPPPPPMPTLKSLTIRTSSIDSMGPQQLWGWIRDLLPNPGLETFKLHAFILNVGSANIPRMFILDLATVQKDTLKHFIVGEIQLTLMDIECICSKFHNLETIGCSVASPDAASIASAIRNGRNLTTLELQVQWLPDTKTHTKFNFSAEDAKQLMLRTEDSRLRVIVIGSRRFTGKWALKDGNLSFEVTSNVAEDKWHT